MEGSCTLVEGLVTKMVPLHPTKIDGKYQRQFSFFLFKIFAIQTRPQISSLLDLTKFRKSTPFSISFYITFKFSSLQQYNERIPLYQNNSQQCYCNFNKTDGLILVLQRCGLHPFFFHGCDSLSSITCLHFHSFIYSKY